MCSYYGICKLNNQNVISLVNDLLNVIMFLINPLPHIELQKFIKKK